MWRGMRRLARQSPASTIPRNANSAIETIPQKRQLPKQTFPEKSIRSVYLLIIDILISEKHYVL